MKIQFIISSLGAGGAERALTLLANSWSHAGHAVSILTLAGDATPPFYPLAPGVLHHDLAQSMAGRALSGKAYGIVQILSSIRKILRRDRPDIAISFMDQTNVLTVLSTMGLRLPLILCEQVHPSYSWFVKTERSPFTRTIMKFLRNQIYRRAAQVVLVAEDGKSGFSSALQRTTTVIPNPIADPIPEDAPLILPPYTILGLGRLTPQKRFDLLLEAFAKIAEANPDWSVTIFGEGPQRAELEALIERLNLHHRAHLAGRTQAPYRALKQAEIFVLSSDFEGFPLALGEAMVSGCAVIATNCPSGPNEMIEHEVSGVLVPLGDRDALAFQMNRLIASNALRKELGTNARERAKLFSTERVSTLWLELIARVIGERHGARSK